MHTGSCGSGGRGIRVRVQAGRSVAALALVLLLPWVANAAEPGAKAARTHQRGVQAPRRELQRRTLRITDASIESVSELHVAEGTPTTVLFEMPLKQGSVILADFKGYFYPPQLSEKGLMLLPRKDLPSGELVTLTVPLTDGTVLPFKLMTVPKLADLQVDVLVALEERAAPESPQALKAAIADLRAQLDDARSQEGKAGIGKVAALVLEQNLDRPEAFAVERHAVHHLDKQARLLVETQAVYRLFNQLYLVLTVQNRDPAKTWVLDRAEMTLGDAAGPGATNLVVQTRAEAPSLAPDAVEKVVVVLEAPSQKDNQRFRLRLLERGGGRHVQLDGLQL